MGFESNSKKSELPVVSPHAEEFDNSETVSEYHRKKNVLLKKIFKIEKEIETCLSDESVYDVDTLDTLFNTHKILILEKIEVSANYLGNWTLLLRERMTDPITKAKFMTQRTKTLEGLKTGEPGKLDKVKYFFHPYRSQMRDYDHRVESIFNRTNVVMAEEHDKKPHHLGSNSIDDVGTIYYNAAMRDGTPLTIRQKNIIEAHEKGHGLRDFTSLVDIEEVQSVIDVAAIEKIASVFREKSSEPFPYSYIRKAEEIIERMAQLKNYFGMKSDEPFTKEHLEYARIHYVSDTQLDNLMSEFFACITPQTEGKFLSIINTYPI
ncbi:MAG: hypothetical protein WAW13_02375 [Minisyncoccia bacterium]